MGIIDRVRSIVAVRRTREPRTPETSRIHQPLRTQASVVVTPDTAVQVPAVLACLRYLSQTVGVLPWRVMQPSERGGVVARRHPVDWLLHKRPSDEWSSMQFRETLTSWALRWGNGYAEIERDTIGRPVALCPIHPTRVEVKRDPLSGKLYYRVANDLSQGGTAGSVDLAAADMFHIRGFGESVVGISVIEYAAETIGWARAAQIFGAAFFGSGANPSALITTKRALSPEGLDEFKKRFARLYSGVRGDKTVVLDNDMDFKQLSVSPEQAQFIATNQHLVEEVCRIFGVPPHKVMHLLRATFSNIEHQSIEVVVDSITPWVKRFEDEADHKLFGANRQGFYCKMNLNALLRGDSRSRMEFYKGLRHIGVLSANDILELEDMPTIGTDGDKLVMQSQFTTLEKIGEEMPAPAPAFDGDADADLDEADDANDGGSEDPDGEDDDEDEAEAAARARFFARFKELADA
jgi:HK97 family phage portal protein